jgi:hypothetical protein
MMVKLKTKRIPKLKKDVNYKEILEMRVGYCTKESVVANEEDEVEYISKDDLEGLARLLRMHNKGRLIKCREEPKQAESSRIWA